MSKIRQRNYYCAGCQQSENYKDSSAQNRLEIWNKRVVLTHCTYYVGEWNTFSKIFMFRWWNKYLHTWVFLLFMIQLLTVIKWTVKLTQVKKKTFPEIAANLQNQKSVERLHFIWHVIAFTQVIVLMTSGGCVYLHRMQQVLQLLVKYPFLIIQVHNQFVFLNNGNTSLFTYIADNNWAVKPCLLSSLRTFKYQ